MPIDSIPRGGSIPPAARRQQRPRRKEHPSRPSISTHTPRVWVFAKEPKFVRFQKTLRVQRVDEPAVDVFSQADQITLIAQLPGASMEELELNIEGDIVMIEAMGTLSLGRVTYWREVLLPFEVEAVPRKLTFNNGILEIDLRRKPKKTKDRRPKT